MPNSNAAVLEELRWKKFPLLNDGFVCLVDAMGDDGAVVQAARVSYNTDLRDGDTTANDTTETLLRYLMRHRHSTPLEMAELKFLVRVPMDCWRQWIRHRMASVNEYSTRYTKAIDSKQETAADEWRLQATNNKQGSDGSLAAWPKGREEEYMIKTHQYAGAPSFEAGPGAYLSWREGSMHEASDRLYEERLDFGIAKEQARKDLPLSTYTEAYWKIDLHNLLHFLGLRMDSHAQKEIRDYATVIGEQIVAKMFPEVWAAFKDYRLNAKTLSARDIGVVQRLMSLPTGFPVQVPEPDSSIWDAAWQGLTRCRERDECVDKLRLLGMF